MRLCVDPLIDPSLAKRIIVQAAFPVTIPHWFKSIKCFYSARIWIITTRVHLTTQPPKALLQKPQLVIEEQDMSFIKSKTKRNS